MRAIVIEELRRVHEGTLARYGLRQSQFLRWQDGSKRISLSDCHVETQNISPLTPPSRERYVALGSLPWNGRGEALHAVPAIPIRVRVR